MQVPVPEMIKVRVKKIYGSNEVFAGLIETPTNISWKNFFRGNGVRWKKSVADELVVQSKKAKILLSGKLSESLANYSKRIRVITVSVKLNISPRKARIALRNRRNQTISFRSDIFKNCYSSFNQLPTFEAAKMTDNELEGAVIFLIQQTPAEAWREVLEEHKKLRAGAGCYWFSKWQEIAPKICTVVSRAFASIE